MNPARTSLGICIGATALKIVEIDAQQAVGYHAVQNHECNPRRVLAEALDSLRGREYSSIAVTGRKFKDLVDLPAITELEATEYALKHFLRKQTSGYRALLSLGGENFILYELNSRGNIVNVHTGNKCASGTGEFFLQQIRRMNVGVEEAIALARQSSPFTVSGRCSVFCKSDCTHALNRGVPIGRVCAGLGNMIAEKALELMKSLEPKDILVVGGLVKNTYVVERLRERIRNLVIPEQAEMFEALGAALYAMENEKKPAGGISVRNQKNSYGALPRLADFTGRVEFKNHPRGMAREGDECILGLDVGSTTTKAVLLRTADTRIIASVYLRTNGNPVQASRDCYRELGRQLNGTGVGIVGLGVTGSGRHIAGLHAFTDGIINEIIAHATGATFFAQDVDTIIEIGGQDAKYTYLVNGVPCDYAMNEACSAGTGSFLEEAAQENLGVSYLDIQDIALRADNPPNFNDQCAAFISSDIKSASHEDISRENIIAGLVYSICMNYINRVKGSRTIGEKVFMQGGVCYNKAVPLAMAALLNRRITVPPEPGLIGAFGVALEIQSRISRGAMKKSRYSLEELAAREVEYGESFACPGTQEHCDRGCQVSLIRINGKQLPFGGICNKYYNTVHHLSIDPRPLDLVEKRQQGLFPAGRTGAGTTVGIPKSFYANILYPLYETFFRELGLGVILGETVDPGGARMVNASFCYPAEIAHGMFAGLLKQRPDYIFLPQVAELFVKGSTTAGKEHHCTCVLAQSEPYYLRSAFRGVEAEIISPVLNFSGGWASMEEEFVQVGRTVGRTPDASRQAFRKGLLELEKFTAAKEALGDEALRTLREDPSKIGIVIFGRAYNAFAGEANLGIPRKFASRGVLVIPFDCLRSENEESIENMNWAIGQEIVKAARVVKKHPQLFGAYITNFSCGPDSFLVGYFRDIMKTKPSLTLELDSHSADAGINTRVEAFLDIIGRYRSLGILDAERNGFRPAELRWVDGNYTYISSDGEACSVYDRSVTMLLPSMGSTTTELAAAALRGIGFNARALPVPDFQTLMLGRANTSCKECVPLILTTASLVDAAERRKSPGERLIYFMPTASGNCRFSQYYVFQKQMIEKKGLADVALLTLTAENDYAGLGVSDQLKVLKAIVVADVLDDIRNALLVLPIDAPRAEETFGHVFGKITESFERGCADLTSVLGEAAGDLARIPLRYPLTRATKVLLTGEIYVRKDEFCSQEVVKRLARRDIITTRAPVLEWLYYVDYIVKHYLRPNLPLGERTELLIRRLLHNRIEKKIKTIMAKSGLYTYHTIDMEKIIQTGSHWIHPAMTGEAIVVIGTFFREIARHVHGVISIGPFACMPTRVVESILGPESNTRENARLDALQDAALLKGCLNLPFLSIEADGNPYPQIVEARIESFALQAERLHTALGKGNSQPARSPLP
jgi:predicted CoA-substrate-specific enzyme activase